MSESALAFMYDTSRPHVHDEVRVKIMSLFKEIDTLYKQHLRKSTNRKCDICGKGDNSEIFRVKDLVSGYEHRESESPCLCYNHACGWNISYLRLESNRKYSLLNLHKKVFADKLELFRTTFDKPVLSDEEIDLHFAQYLAKQLTKAAARDKNDG